jgi:hypothetical protein
MKDVLNLSLYRQLGNFLHPEDTGNMFLRHVGVKLQNSAVSKPTTPQLVCIYVCAKSEVMEMCL